MSKVITKMFAKVHMVREGFSPFIEGLFDNREDAYESVLFHRMWRASHRIVPVEISFDTDDIEPAIPDNETLTPPSPQDKEIK